MRAFLFVTWSGFLLCVWMGGYVSEGECVSVREGELWYVSKRECSITAPWVTLAHGTFRAFFIYWVRS